MHSSECNLNDLLESVVYFSMQCFKGILASDKLDTI